MGLASSARLKLTVFQDSNGDGKRGDYDRVVSGIEVTLLDGETPLESTVTDEEGKAAMYAHAGRYTCLLYTSRSAPPPSATASTT